MENFQKNVLYLLKNAPIIDYKNISLLKNMFQKMVKLYHQKLHLYLLVNKKNLTKEIKKS